MRNIRNERVGMSHVRHASNETVESLNDSLSRLPRQIK